LACQTDHILSCEASSSASWQWSAEADKKMQYASGKSRKLDTCSSHLKEAIAPTQLTLSG